MSAEQCANNPYNVGSTPWNDYVNRYQCWIYDSSIQAPSVGYEQEQTSMSSSSVSYESAPAATSAPAASKTVAKGLQTAINRFFGVTLGAPIGVDGVIGGETLAAVNSILAWMPQAGYDTSAVTRLIGDRPTAASISLRAAELSNVLDWIADDNNFTLGQTPSPPSVPATQGSSGKMPAFTPPMGSSQRAAAGILGLGLPNWVVYAGAGALVLSIAMMVRSRKKRKAGVSGVRFL